MASRWSSTNRSSYANLNRSSMRRSGTFLLKQSQPMVPAVQVPSPNPNPNPNPMIPTPPPTPGYKKPNRNPAPVVNAIEYPASPQLVVGEEILHFSHPQHPLSEMILPDLYTCAGCKEFGSGRRFSCQICDFQLHHFCALAPPALSSHPFHSHHHLLLYSKPVKSGIYQSSNNKCDVCAKATKGFAFRCGGGCGFQMHPCCAMLPEEIVLPSHPHALRVVPGGEQAGHACGECKRRRPGKVFRCPTCDYHVHAVCAKDLVNGLMANGLKPRLDRPSVLGAAAKVASVALIDFLGGLIEGLGEGVGQAIVARGR